MPFLEHSMWPLFAMTLWSISLLQIVVELGTASCLRDVEITATATLEQSVMWFFLFVDQWNGQPLSLNEMSSFLHFVLSDRCDILHHMLLVNLLYLWKIHNLSLDKAGFLRGGWTIEGSRFNLNLTMCLLLVSVLISRRCFLIEEFRHEQLDCSVLLLSLGVGSVSTVNSGVLMAFLGWDWGLLVICVYHNLFFEWLHCTLLSSDNYCFFIFLCFESSLSGNLSCGLLLLRNLSEDVHFISILGESLDWS